MCQHVQCEWSQLMPKLPRILVAGMGNILRQDDGFGVHVAQKLLEDDQLPNNVTVVEVGTGGISLVQEMIDPDSIHPAKALYDVLFLLDATERKGEPGQVYVLEAQVPDIDDLPEHIRRDFLADMHYSVPSRALTLAKALGVLPLRTYIVGCQPEFVEEYQIGLSEVVSDAVERTVTRMYQLISEVTG